MQASPTPWLLLLLAAPLWGCGGDPAADDSPADTAADTATDTADTGADTAADTADPDGPVTCLACHADQAMLLETMEPVDPEEGGVEGTGEG